MKRKLFTALQIFILIASLAANTSALVLAAGDNIYYESAASPVENVASSGDSTVGEAPNTGDNREAYIPPLPADTPPYFEGVGLPPIGPEERPAAQTGNYSCAMNFTVVIYREDPGETVDPTLFPVTRILPFNGGVGWDSNANPNLAPPRPGDAAVNNWDSFPNTLPLPRFLQWNPSLPTYGGTVGMLFKDVRIDERFNYTALRGEQLYALVLIRNSSAASDANCDVSDIPNGALGRAINSPFVDASTPEPTMQTIAQGDGQNVVFTQVDVEIADRDKILTDGETGQLLSFTLTPEDFVNSYLNPNLYLDDKFYNSAAAPGLIERRASGTNPPDTSDAYKKSNAEVYYAIIPFTVPEDAVGYLEARTSGLQFNCTYFNGANNAVGGGDDCPAATPQGSVAVPGIRYYVSTLGGPWLYQDGDTNAEGFPTSGAASPYTPAYTGFDPFETTHLVGGQNNRSEGDAAWFVLEVKNKWPAADANGTDSRSIKTIVQTGGNPLTACDGANGTGAEGWYSTVEVDRDLGVISGTKVPDPTNLQLGGQESVYCVFTKNLNTGGTGVFNFAAQLDAQAYTTSVESEVLAAPVNVNIAVTVASGDLRVDKQIISPVSGNPPQPDLVRPGDTVTYQITLTNVGEVPLDTLTFNDNLTGPFLYNPAITLDPPDTVDPYACSGTCSVSTQVQYVVQEDDPNPLFNTVVGTAEIVNTSVVLQDFDSASIILADAELQIVLTATGNINATPVLGQDTYVTYEMNYFNNSDLPFTNIRFVELKGTEAVPPNPPDAPFYPLLQDPGSINTYLPNYPAVEVYSNTPPTGTSTLIYPTPGNPFAPGGTFTPVRWDYQLPIPPADLSQPFDDYPLFQEVVLEATRSDGTTVQGRATLITEVENPNADIRVKLIDSDTGIVLYDPLVDPIAPTVLRNETLNFSLEVEHTDINNRCDVFVRVYQKNPNTGAETLVNPDVKIDWPSAAHTLPGSVGGNPVIVGTGDVPPPDYVQYQVSDTSPDPLILIFEFDARKGCVSPANDNPFLVDRVAVVFDVSNINIDRQLVIVTGDSFSSTTQVTSGIYPLDTDQTYQLLYRADNNGPINPEIINLKYCLVMPANITLPDGEDCTSGGISMLGDDQPPIPPFPATADFGVQGPFGDSSRIFTTATPRSDRRMFTLSTGVNYPNPLIIQVILEVTDTGNAGDVTRIRDFLVFPMSTDDLDFSLSSTISTIVRGDHGIPVTFSFTNTLATTLQNVSVLDLMNQVVGGGNMPAISQVNPLGPYKYCQLNGANPTTIPSLAPGEQVTGTCYFDFTTDVVWNDVFTASVVATEQGTNRPVFDLATIEFEQVPHLDVTKTGSESVLNSQVVDYTVVVVNNSKFQYVDFDDQAGFSDIFSPVPSNSKICIVSGSALVPPAYLCGANNTGTVPNPPGILMQYFTGVQQQINGTYGANTYRLLKSVSENLPRSATISYRLVPIPYPGGSHGEKSYENVARFTGTREYDPTQVGEEGEVLVSGSDDHEVELQCPIRWTMNFAPRGPGYGEDYLFSLGEEVAITVQARNYSDATVFFDTLLDPRYAHDTEQDSLTGITFRDEVTWPAGFLYQLPPFDSTTGIAQPLTYTFYMRLDTVDFLALPNGEFDLKWAIFYTTSGLPPSPGCSTSNGNPNNEDDSIVFELPVLPPVFPFKSIDTSRTPPPILVEGEPIKYLVDVTNVSETTDISVEYVHESLFDRDLIVAFCNSQPPLVSGVGGLLLPQCSASTESSSGVLWRYENSTNALWDVRPATALADPTESEPTFGGLPLYLFDKDDLESPDAEKLVNRVSVQYHVESSTASWLTPNTLAYYIEHEVQVVNPLEVTETVLVPEDGVVSRPGQITYFVTVRNTSADVTATNLVLTNIDPFFEYPICGVTPPYNDPFNPVDLDATPYVCLENMPFSLSPGEEVSVIVNYFVSDTNPATVITTQSQLTGTLILDGVPYPFDPPPVVSQVNEVEVERPLLTARHQAYADNACTIPLVNVTVPNRDKNDDGTPELEVGGGFYYGIGLYVNSGRTYDDVEVSVNMFNGNVALTNAVNQALLNLAVGGTNPNVTLNAGGPAGGSDIRMTDNNNPDTSVAEAFLCVPQPSGLTIVSKLPDPLIVQTTVTGIEQPSGDLSIFVTEDEPIDEDNIGLLVEQNLVLDITDPNVFISKMVNPTSAFPDEVVTYTITIQNLTNRTILIQDVYDSNIGVGQQFFDYDNNAFTPPEPLRYHDPVVPGLSSIPFDIYQSTDPNGLGWSWTPGNEGVLPPSGSVTYVYERLITDIDPNPLVNMAGMLGLIDNDPPEQDIEVSDQTINELLVSDSQLNVVKTAIPTTTILGTSIFYSITITNIGDDPVYDILVWDDKYNLQNINQGYISLIPNVPQNPSVLILGGHHFLSVAGADDDLLDLGGQNSAVGIPRSVTIEYNLPLPPSCVEWAGTPNQPFDPINNVPVASTGGTCGNTFTNPVDLPLIDPFINTAWATGLIDDGNGNLVYLDKIGHDRAIVDIINPNLRIQKIAGSDTAAIGTDLDYTIRITNTGTDRLRIDEVIDRTVPNSETGDLPIESLTFENCPVPGGVSTSPSGTNNLQGTTLLPFITNGANTSLTSTSPLNVNNTSILFPGCSASATILITVPNPLPDNEYVNVVQVTATNLATGATISDLTSETIEVTATGLEITKRAWDCDTAENGHLPPTSCTAANRELATEANEGETVYYEISLLNSGTADLNSLQLTDNMLVNFGTGLEPYGTRIPDGTTYTDAKGNVYVWTNGALIIGVQSYRGLGLGTCGSDNPLTNDDESYDCDARYFGFGNGPFGDDDPSTASFDESYLFEPLEEFERPDPGPVAIPAITYKHVVSFPDDDLDNDERYVNRVRVVGTPITQGLPPLNNFDDYILEIHPATVNVDVRACVENDGDPSTFDPYAGNPCVSVARPDQDVWYEITLSSDSLLELENITVSDTVRGNIPINLTDASCWVTPPVPPGTSGWPGGTAGILNFGESVVCTYKRGDVVPALPPLQVSNDPYTNTVTVNFDIDPGTPPLLHGQPATDSATIRIAQSEMLVTVDGCLDQPLQVPSGSLQIFDIIIENLDAIHQITNVNVSIPEPLGTSNIPLLDPAGNPGAVQTLQNAMQVQVPTFGPATIDYIVVAEGLLEDGTPTGTLINAAFICTVQRVDGSMVVTKDAVNLATGSNVARVGDTIRYTISVENLNQFAPIINFNITDPLLENTVQNLPLVDWDTAWGLNTPNPAIGAGATQTHTFEYVVPADTDPIINIATASGDVAGVTPVSSSDTARIDVAEGDIVVAAFANPNPVIAGNNIVFTYRVCNIAPANGTVYNIFTLEDNDPSGTPLKTGLQHPDSSLQLGGQECAFFQRTVPTTLADAGNDIQRTVFAQGCPVLEATTPCPDNVTVSDGQVATVSVIAQPSDTATIDVHLTANKLGVSISDVVTYTLTVTNLNTLYPATLQLYPSQLGVFDPSNPLINHPIHQVTLQPLTSASQTLSYTFDGLADPLVESVTIGYTINGVTGTATDTVSLPVISVAGSTLVLKLDTLEGAGTPGGKITFRYTVTNIGSSVVSDAYIYNRLFYPDTPAITACLPYEAGEAWGLGNDPDTTASNVIYPVSRYIPPIFPNGFSRTGRIVCDVPISFPIDPPTNLLHTAWVNRQSVNLLVAEGAVQDKETVTIPIVPPLQVTLKQLGVAVPGGPVAIEFSVQNIGPANMTGVRLFAFPPPECESNWLTQDPFTTGSLWNTSGANIAVGATVTATASCNIPVDYLNGIPSTVFQYPADTEPDVTIEKGGVIFDTADPIAINVLEPVAFQFIPPSNNPTLEYIRAGDTVQLVFRLYNSGPTGFSVNSLNYDIQIGNSTCDSETATLSTGGTFVKGSSSLAANGDYVEIVCSYTPDETQSGVSQKITFTASHVVNGTIVDVQIPNPLADPNGDPYQLVVEDVDLLVELSSNAGASPANVDDGNELLFNLTVTNTGQVALNKFNFTEVLVNTFTGATVKENIWGDLNALFTTECGATLAAGASCTMGNIPYTVQTSDPQQITIRVVVEAETASSSPFEVANTAQWQANVRRPVLEIAGPASGTYTAAGGLTWVTVPGNISVNPNPAVVDGEVTISVTLRNAGYATFSSMTLNGSISAPSGTAGISLTSAAQQTPPVDLSFTLPTTTLAPGASVTATAVWTVTGVTPPTTVNLTLHYTGEVEGTYPPYDITIAPIPISVVAPGAELAANGLLLDPNATEPVITKVASVASAFPGDSVAWTITITNLWTEQMESVSLTDAVPGDLEVVSASTSSGASIVNDNLVDVTTGPLEPGQSVIVTVNTTVAVTASIPGIVTNVACGSREGGEQVCAESILALGPGGLLPDTGIGGQVGSIQTHAPLTQRLPFFMAIFGMFFVMMSLNMTNRQRIALAVLAVLVVVGLIGIVLVISGGEGGDEDDIPQITDGSPPPQAFNTATPVSTEVAENVTPTIEPTIAADVLATLASFPATATPYIPPTPAGPRRLDIPVLNYVIPLPIVELPQINGEWDVTNLGHNIGWLDNTTWLDPTWGNTVLVGHIQLSDTDPGPFKHLDRLVPGDEIHVLEGSNVSVYKVTDIFTVSPTDNAVTHPTEAPTLTLITCTNWADSRGVFADRLVIQAIPAANFGG